MQYLTLEEDAAGQSHFIEQTIAMTEQEFAPPAPSMLVSEAVPASRLVFVTLPVGWVGEMHPSPRRQVGFVLRGRIRVEAGDGETREVAAGGIWRMEDVSGSGHRSAVVGSQNVELAIVQF